jgi:hypothetical protein
MTINVRIKPNGDFLPERIEKDPEDVIEVTVDYSQYFKTTAITSFTIEGTSVTIDSSSETDNIITLFMSGGTRETHGEIKLTVSSTTQTLERTLIVRIVEK